MPVAQKGSRIVTILFWVCHFKACVKKRGDTQGVKTVLICSQTRQYRFQPTPFPVSWIFSSFNHNAEGPNEHKIGLAELGKKKTFILFDWLTMSLHLYEWIQIIVFHTEMVFIYFYYISI